MVMIINNGNRFLDFVIQILTNLNRNKIKNFCCPSDANESPTAHIYESCNIIRGSRAPSGEDNREETIRVHKNLGRLFTSLHVWTCTSAYLSNYPIFGMRGIHPERRPYPDSLAHSISVITNTNYLHYQIQRLFLGIFF